MKCKETTPERTFSVEMTETERSILRAALHYTISSMPDRGVRWSGHTVTEFALVHRELSPT